MKKVSTKKRKLNSKKGISLVIAIALVAVLFLTTTSFLSIAMLQQNETGTSMNSRQAYVSAKSVLDVAEDFLNNDLTFSLPLSKGTTYYYVFYYDAAGNITYVQKATLQEIWDWINQNPDITIIGNAYVKIKMNDDGTYTITAVGKENKYNDTNGGNTGDLSAKFNYVKRLVPTPENKKLVMQQKNITVPSVPSSSTFMMLGDQGAFSLLRSAYYKNHSKDQTLYRTLKESNPDDKGNILYIPQLEATEAPIISQFPLVFDKTVQIDSDSNSRCNYTAYDNGIYLLGNTSNDELKNKYNGASNAASYAKSDSYGAVFACRYIAINGNLVAKPSNGTKSFVIKYAGSGYDSNKSGVVINFIRDIYCVNTNSGDIKYEKGYYFLPISDNTNGVDLFNPTTKDKLVDIKDIKSDYPEIAAIDMTKTLFEGDPANGKLKNMHSAFENNSSTSSKKVVFLKDNGEFGDGKYVKTGSEKIVGNSATDTTKDNEYYTGWEDHYIYCAPTVMPPKDNSDTYYDFYAGKEFNFMWYNIESMNVNSHVKMSIRSRDIVISIGPDQGEKAYYTSSTSFTYPRIFNDYNAPNGLLQDPNLRTYTSNNNLVQKDSSASFSLKPYWNESSYTITIANDFVVKMYDGTTYTIKKGTYTKDLPSTGLDLFSNGKTYFENHNPTQSDGLSGSSFNWVNTDGTINTSCSSLDLDQGGSPIIFEAPAGGTLTKEGTYKAASIHCNFGNTVNGNDATLCADVVTISATTIDGNGSNNGLKINTHSGYSDSNCKLVDDGRTLDGSMLQFVNNVKIIFEDGSSQTFSAGYYYFDGIKGDFDITKKSFWSQWNSKTNPYYYSTTLNNEVVDGTAIHYETQIDPISFEGKYY